MKEIDYCSFTRTRIPVSHFEEIHKASEKSFYIKFFTKALLGSLSDCFEMKTMNQRKVLIICKFRRIQCCTVLLSN